MTSDVLERFRDLVNRVGRAVAERPEEYIDFEAMKEVVMEDIENGMSAEERAELARELGIDEEDVPLLLSEVVLSRLIIDYDPVRESEVMEVLEKAREWLGW